MRSLVLPLFVASCSGLSACSGAVNGQEPGSELTMPASSALDEGSASANSSQTDPAMGAPSNVAPPTSGAATTPVASGNSAAPPASAPGSAPLTETAAPELTARTWRLTHEQYQATIKLLFDVEVDLSNFAEETGNGKFINFSSTNFVRVDLAANYFAAAKSVAAEISTTRLSQLTSCDLRAECSAAFITELALRVFRRPAPSDLAVRYQSLIDTALADTTGEATALEAGFRAVLAAMLNSPLFLYRTEIGSETDEAAATFTLTPHELAEELAYSLIGQAPPEWLAALANSGALAQPGGLESAIAQLLDDPAANAQLTRFLTEFLEVHDFTHVEKSDVFPGFSDIKPQMQQEVTAFLAQNGQQSSKLSDLLLGAVPEVAPELTQYYLSDASAAAGSTRVGVLGLGAVLSSHAKSYLSSPTLRGRFIRGRFFCQEINLPTNFTPPPLSDTEVLKTARTTRELYEQHQANPSCAPCHELTDNLGFTLEGFDGAGRFRSLDTTQGAAEPINLTSELTHSDVDRPLTSAEDLSRALSESAQVRECLARQAFRFYFGQGESTAQLPAIVQANNAFQNATLRELLVGLFSTDTSTARVREPAP